MKITKTIAGQTASEENLNFLSHLIGAIAAIIGMILMLLKSDELIEYISSAIYGFGMLLTFSASSIYHYEKDPKRKKFLRIFDHAGIFTLIAGTYTPLSLLVLGEDSYIYLIIEWSIAIVGIILKIFYTGRFEKLSLAIYLIMGWIIIFDIANIYNNSTLLDFWLILGGGISYSVGAVFYALKKLKYSHVIWHVFVLAGAFLHFLYVYTVALN